MNQKEFRSRFEALIYNLQEGVLVEDENRRILLVNQLFLDMFAIPANPEQMKGMNCSNAAEDTKHLFTEPESFVKNIDIILQKKEIVHNDYLVLADGRSFERDFVPVFIREKYMGHLWVYRDITVQHQREQEIKKQAEELARLNEILKEEANIDPLTGILNRRGVMEKMRSELARCIRYNSEASLAIVDIDRFKSINDTYGHKEGDLVLRALAITFQSILRNHDLCGRIGGEEFVLYFPETPADSAIEICHRLLEHFSSLEFNGFTSTFSCGVTELTSAKSNAKESDLTSLLNDLIQDADEALYTAKKSGRNQIHLK